MEVLLHLCVCVIWDKAIKDFCTDFHQERMWVPWEATHQLIKSNQAISCSELILSRGQTDKGMPFYQWRSQGGGHGGHGPPQTFGECFFSPINLRRYVLLVCK